MLSHECKVCVDVYAMTKHCLSSSSVKHLAPSGLCYSFMMVLTHWKTAD